MDSKILGAALVAVTVGIVAYYPALHAHYLPTDDPNTVVDSDPLIVDSADEAIVDVVFVLDTTGSMSGLIQTAKDKIWSIATTMAGAQPTPIIRIGLVAYRDRGDDYVTKTIDLSADLDSVYAELMDFEAAGGGDGPESVNAALEAAVDDMSWTQNEQAYRVVFLVGDAPPHRDYADERQFPEIVAAARQQGIVVNAIQCGELAATAAPWGQIASLGGGAFFQVEQAGGAVAHATPFDKELAALTAKLDATRLYYGTAKEKEAMAAKQSATDKLSALASDEAKARRGVFNLSKGGRANRLGENELVAAVASGAVDLDAIAPAALPESLKPLPKVEQKRYLQRLAEERADVTSRMRELAASRQAYIEERVASEGGAKGSLDQKLYDTIREQAAVADLEYDDGPAY